MDDFGHPKNDFRDLHTFALLFRRLTFLLYFHHCHSHKVFLLHQEDLSKTGSFHNIHNSTDSILTKRIMSIYLGISLHWQYLYSYLGKSINFVESFYKCEVY